MSKISVIIPVYNVEQFLDRCIKSIRKQSYLDFELIIVDDGAQDNSGRICDDYIKNDNRIIVIHKKNGGLSDARNAGLNWTYTNNKSSWITFIDSDDWVHPNYLSTLYFSNIKNNTLISSCETFFTKGSDFNNIDLDVKEEVLEPEEFYTNYCNTSIHAWGKLYSKELLESIRFPFGLIHEDVFFTYKAIFKSNSVSVIQNELYAYFSSPGSIMRKSWNPERLAVFIGYDEQLSYFNNNNYTNAYKRCVEIIAETYCDQMSQIQREESGNKKNYLLLRKRLRCHLKKYKKATDFSIRNYPYFYSNAYPIYSYLFWLIDSQFNKIRRKNDDS